MADELIQSIIDAGRWIDAQGWCPATGGNFSVRDGDTALVTASGRHKGHLSAADILRVDFQGQPLGSSLKPSAETLLHTALYALDPAIGAVLHTHSVTATVLSRIVPAGALVLQGYEMQKSLAGNDSHEDSLRIAILDNSQDMAALAAVLKQGWQLAPLRWGFLVRGHGLYCWGREMAEARRHLEGLEFLFACELEMWRLGVNA